MSDRYDRKLEEQQFHDELRLDPAKLSGASNNKFYAITQRSTDYVDAWLASHCEGATILDYGCGEGFASIQMAKAGGQVISIDISPGSLKGASEMAREADFGDRISFLAMDAESLAFDDDMFDVIHISGVLHHLDVQIAFPEISRVLKTGGHVIATEALGHNPVIQWYRTKTPQLRTEWEAEHIIKREQLRFAGKYFSRVDYRFFHLASLAAVPFRKIPLFGSAVLAVLDVVDNLLLRIPVLKWQAWYIVVDLSRPKRVDESMESPAHDQ